MIDFSLTDEQLAIQDLARRFAREEIRPVAAEYDEREQMPWPVLAKAAQVGLLSYGLPEEYGGGGVPDGLVGITELPRHRGAGLGLRGDRHEIGSSVYAAGPILAFGTEEQRRRYLPMLCDSRDGPARRRLHHRAPGRLRCSSMRTTARRAGDGWVLDGVKQFITNGGIADVHIVFARIPEEESSGGFIVEKGTPAWR